ncbi:MAG: response regulator [Candidatus Doudnabacteria bacterium]
MNQKILVADDDLAQRDLYVDLFKEGGYQVTTADDGQDAWEKIQQNKPDLVFTGILMPHMSGFELIEKLRSNKSTETTPVIIFSHLGRPEDRAKAGKLPFVEFMVKGFDRPINIVRKAEEMLTYQPPQTPVDPDEDKRQGFSVL